MTKNMLKLRGNASKKGFTIIETLVAVSILTVAIMGAMTAAQAGISSYILSKDQVLAFYFAQEGFEQIRNLRDENRLKKLPWLQGIAENPSDPCYFGEKCTVSPIESVSPVRCPVSGCPLIRYNTTTGFYGYNSGWRETIYRREISLKRIEPGEISITVTMRWSKGIIERQFTARENLFNW